jgi:6-phospho-3-hexuloisomerase
MMLSRGIVTDETARVLADLDDEILNAIVERVRSCEGAVTFTGQGRSGAVGSMTAMRLMHLGFNAHVQGEPTSPSVGRGDLLIASSGSGATPVTIHFARIAKAAGAGVIVVTRTVHSELADQADLVLEIPATGSQQPGGSLFEQSALLAFDIVVHALSLSIPDAATLLRSRHTNLQ